MSKTESIFEKRVIRHFRSIGWFAAHLNGPAGWPDVIATEYGKVRFFELKSLRVANWKELEMRTVFEQSQPAFVIANPMVDVMVLLATDDGDFIFTLTQDIAKKIPDGLRFRNITIQPWRCEE